MFATQARFPASAVSIAGTSHTFVRIGDEGGKGIFHFCPTCGVTVYYINEGVEDSIAIPVGVFADPAFPPPMISVYEERMHGWVAMPKDIEHMD